MKLNHKKSNAHLTVTNNGTIGGQTHGYGPIGSKSHNAVSQQSSNAYNHIPMQLNVLRQPSNSGNSSAVNSKIPGKLKKKHVMNNNISGINTSCNTNPNRDNSVDATATYGNNVRSGVTRERSEGQHVHHELNYGSGGESQGQQISPRGGKSIEKMNVMNFIKQKKNDGGAITDIQPEFQKSINRQNSKKLIQGKKQMGNVQAANNFSN